MNEAAIKQIIQEWMDEMKVLAPDEEIVKEEADREVLREALRKETKGKGQDEKYFSDHSQGEDDEVEDVSSDPPIEEELLNPPKRKNSTIEESFI